MIIDKTAWSDHDHLMIENSPRKKLYSMIVLFHVDEC